jgi:hypothetical protein
MNKSSVSTSLAKRIMSILLILRYNGSLVTCTVASFTTDKFNPIIFSMSGFALSYATNMFILMILYDFCLLPAQFCYIIVYIWQVESRVQIANRCTPWTISNGAEGRKLKKFKVRFKVALRLTVYRQFGLEASTLTITTRNFSFATKPLRS